MNLLEIQTEINQQIGNKETFHTLVATTFKGLAVENVKRAIMEGMMRGFKFSDFLEKNVYAIPFKDGYSLVTSIDYARKIGMRSGVVGVSAPVYEEKENKIVSCTVTVKRKVAEYIGEYSATVFFDEYNSGRNQWVSKPRTMIAKVAEMHALRKACPEELSMSYSEEEISLPEEKSNEMYIGDFKARLEATKSLEELRTVFGSLSGEMKKELRPLADQLKLKYESIPVSE